MKQQYNDTNVHRYDWRSLRVALDKDYSTEMTTDDDKCFKALISAITW